MPKLIPIFGALITTLIAGALASGAVTGKLRTVGVVFGANSSTARPYEEAFRAGMRDLGYVDGKNVKILTRYANGDASRVPKLRTELVALPVEVLVATNKAVREAGRATRAIPIVCPTMGDPLRDRLVASLAHPGGNLTGLSIMAWETDTKRLELLTETVPNLVHVGVLFDGADSSLVAEVESLKPTARRLGLTIHELRIGNLEDVRIVLKATEKEHVQALLVIDSAITLLHIEEIMRLAAHRLPIVSEGREWAERGGLLAYAPDYPSMWKQAATYVDKILRGAKPGDLPIEQPTRFVFVASARAAKTLHLAIPQSILLQADEIIQ
jgi:ABC-type uncharacterized transport system substrate-binding protein